MDENCSVFPEANGEAVEEQCKRRQSGILKASRSPLRTIKEIDISQKLVPVGKLRRSSRRVSFAETKEIKEFVTDKIIHADVEDDETISTLHCKQNMETYNTRDSEKENLLEELGRDMMPQDTNFKIAGMDALLHAPLRTSLQSECCEHPQTFSKHQTFTISGLEVRRDEETVTSSESKFSPEFQKKLDFRCFLAELNSTKPPSSNMRHGKEEEISDMLFSSDRHNTVPKHQKTIDFKSFFSTVKQTETENRIISMHSTFEEQVYKQADLLVTSPCKAVELTNHSMFQNHAISNLDANKTILFPDHDNDTEITRSHTVPITNLVLGKFDTCHSVNNTEKLGNRGSLSLFLPQDKAVVFSGEDFTGVTRNTIEPNDVQMIENLTNQNQPTVVTAKRNERSILPSSSSDGHAFTGFEFLGKSEQNKARGTTKQTSRSLDMSCYPNKTLLFLNDNDMDITKSHTVTIDNASFRKVPISTAGSSTFVPCDKTKMFSEANDMDIMQSHTVAIESDHLGQVSNKPLQPTRKNSRQSVPGSLLASLPNEKTVVFSEANVMDLTRSHTVTIDNGSLGPVPLCRAGSNASFPCDKTRMFSRANDMDITQSHTVAIESDRLERVSNKLLQSTRKNSRLSIPGSILTLLPNEKTMEFSEANDMDLTKSHTLNIDNANLGSVPICTAGSSVSFPCDKTKTFSEVNDMDITQSHTVAIESDRLERVSNKPLQTTRKNSRPSVPGSILASLPNEKTVVFSEANVMDLTRSHTVTIDNGSLGPVPICTAGSSAPFPCDKTRMFSKANDMDITQSHTVAIESDRPERVSNKPLQTTRTNSRPSVPGSILASLPNEKTVVFSEANVMDLTRSHTVTIDNGSLGAVPICTTGSSASFPCDKTMMFSKANDMDITQSHTIAIESDRLERVSNKPLQTTRKNSRPSVPGSILASLPNEKTVVFSEANVMDLTRSHTVTIDNGRLGAVPICTTGSSASFPCDKTMMFSKANDMDITQSHTIAIESDRLERVSNKPLQTTRKNSRPSVPGSILASLPNEKTLVFSEANVMDLTRRHTVTIDNGRLGAVPICTTGSSASFPCDKTRMFSKANDMDITQSHTVAIESDRLEGVSNKPLQTTRKNSRPSVPGSILASLPNEKTLVFSEANVMDLTRSHTVTIDNGSLGAVPICTTGSSASFPCDKTSMFSKANDMDITQSHTVAIESDRLERVSNKPLQTTRKNSRPSVPGSILASLPNEKTLVFSEANVMDLTRSHTVTIDNGSLGAVPICTTGSSASFPCDKTSMFSKANDMDITQSHTVAIESDRLERVSNKPLQTTRKNSRPSVPGSILASLPNEKTVVFSEANVMDLTRSHTVTIDNASLGPICTAGSSASFPCDKTKTFSEVNDMDITQSHKVAIESDHLGQVSNKPLQSTMKNSRLSLSGSKLASLSNKKTMMFSEANDIDLTRSHTVRNDNGGLGSMPICTVVSSAPFPCDKTESFSEKNDTDTTKSHTVTIEIGSPGPAAKLTVSSAGCIPIGKSIIFSEANHMNPTKSCTIDTDSGSLGTVANGAFCSAKMTSNSNTDGSVLSSYSNKKSMVSDQVAVISTVDKLPVHRRHDESGKSTVTQMMHEKGQNYFSDQMENGNCNMESNLDADSMCITELHEKSNLKGTKQSVPSTENSHTSVTLKHLEVQQKALIDQSREAASEEFVQYQVTECSAHGSGTESADTTKHKDGCDVSRKSSLSNVSSLLKMNCMKPTMGGDVPADCQTLNARPCFPKQNSLVKDTFMSQIALGAFLPKLPSRIVNSNHQNVVKSSVEHLCSDSLLNVTCKAEDLEGSNIPEPNDNLQEQPHKMQVSDCDEVESKTLDWVKPSCSLKSSAVHTLAIDKQQCEEVSSVPAQDINAIGQALIHSKTISTMEQRPNQKRVWSEEESGNACGERKMMRTSEREGTDSSRKEVCITPVVQWEGVGHERGENNLPNLTTKSQESIISLDSTKGDGTSAHAIPPKCNLNTSLVILEESELHKKLMDGEVTVREFFKFFKVQIRAQKSRQSELHVNPELDKSSGLENWLAVKFVHRPKREVYEEDSIALSAAINDQKDQLLDLDKLLAEVNFPLLKEVMQMTKEELQQFRPCLNAKKTTFVKRTKVICHEQKVQLYLSQLNALKTQRQQRKEYEDYLDDMINKMDDCLASLDLGNLGPLVECSMDDIDHDESLMQLKQIVNERHEDLRNLQAEHSKMESELAKVLGEKSQQENAAKMLELNEEFQELLEWTLLPCQDDQAVYSFLYGSLELTLQYGKAEDADLSPGEKCRILDVKVVSQLDEEETPAHSKLVHELILTYWKNRDSWHQTHSKESQLPMLLLDLSLVVSRCRVLGDELEYLLNWGSKFDILKTQIQHMDVKFLFSSYEALSKFEVTFHIMPGYPWLPLQFTFNSWFGNISGEHINKVLLTVKPGHEYLIRIMKSLFLTLLTRPGANRFVTTGLFLTRKR